MERIRLRYLVARNLRFNSLRSILIITCVAVIIGSLFSTGILLEGVDHSIEIGTARLGADLIIVREGSEVEVRDMLVTGNPVSAISVYKLIRGSLDVYFDRSVEEKVATVPGVWKTSPQLFATDTAKCYCPWCLPVDVFIIGFDPETDFTISPWMKMYLDEPLGENDVIIGYDVAVREEGGVEEIRKYAIGETVYLLDQPFTVKGRLDKTGMGIDNCAFMPIDSAYRMAALAHDPYHKIEIEPNEISAVLVKVEPGLNPRDVGVNIQRELNETIPLGVVCPSYIGNTVKAQMSNTLTGMYTLAATSWAVSIVLLAAIFMMSVNERRREVGVLRSIGSTRGFIFKLITLEAVLLTLVGGVIGIIGGGLITYAFGSTIASSLGILHLWPNVTDLTVLACICIGLSVVTGVVAISYPATLSCRLDPHDVVKRE
jgi:putative ABC transport system permease protein